MQITMKPIHRIIALGALACASLTAGTAALAEDMETCRGGYGMMLMTPSECKTYLNQLQEVRARADSMAELELQEWHTELLIQRSQACPCMKGKYIALVQHAPVIQPSRASPSY
jgi:hypothetical protein